MSMRDTSTPPDMIGPLVELGRRLRASDLPVGTGRILTFCQAVGLVGFGGDLYWAARASLISRPEDVGRFDAVFEAWHRALATRPLVSSDQRAGSPDEPTIEAAVAAGHDHADRASRTVDADASEQGDRGSEMRTAASGAEVLRDKSFGDLTDEERDAVADAIRQLSVRAPFERSRRMRAARHSRQLDMRRTLRRSLRTSGEPLERAYRKRQTRRRPIVLVLDISGSMAPYSRAMVQFAFAAMAAGRRIEVFCFGTKLTRVTPVLRTGDPDRALADVGRLVGDWDGGTRIGESLKALLDGWSQRAALRGAVVVVCSDGLERGDPHLLRLQMQRLRRLAHRIVWANPLKGAPGYEPLARGMAAALPNVDRFLSGHDIRSLEQLAGAVGDARLRRP
jgi:uncharacterized protein with von Willebrand factor type A (vWA) domain